VTGAGREARGDDGDGDLVVGDFGDAHFVGGLLRSAEFEIVVFAAGPADVQKSFADPVADFGGQTLPLHTLLDQARQLARPPKVLLVSSAAIYGNPRCVPVSEAVAAAPISPYGFHKLHQELLLDQHASLYGLRTAKARVFSTYGPGLRHLAVSDMTRRALRGDFRQWGTGNESRDYLHIEDVAGALEAIARTARFEGEVVNVASGVETPMREVAQAIFHQLGIDAVPEFGGEELDGSPVRWQADASRLHALGIRPRHDLASGLRDTVEWIRSHA
jgi:nucleoside-diphosphate-sugar epimerase